MDKNNPLARGVSQMGIAAAIDATLQMYSQQRLPHERRWYDNNFFDDGLHFRYVSRTTGKIVDLSDRGVSNMPTRAIPKASRQIRGVANLLMAPEYVPVVYPEKVNKSNLDPEEYKQALEISKQIAKKTGSWVQEEYRKQEIIDKLILMLLLASKHGVSYLQVWQDPVEEKIRSAVFDAFDIYAAGNLSELSDSPSIIKAVPQLISKIKANENFDEAQLLKISPDNKYASSEIKQAYMQSRFGNQPSNDHAATLILKEGFIKEYINKENVDTIRQFSNDSSVLDGKNYGDMVMRHVFCAGGVYLKDEYISIPDYPFVDFRFEPGPLYQVPLIERFIPANKSLDIIASRIEAFANTMAVGVYQKRKGENYEITNNKGAQVIEYDTKPLEQMNLANVPPFMFQFMGFLEKLIEEQGASTSALNSLPDGVKSGVAIESVKQNEFANLKIASLMLQKTVKKITEKFIDIGADFIDPQTVYLLEKGEPSYFDVIGERGLKKRQELDLAIPQGVVPLKKEYLVNIEVESGLGFTQEGKKATMQQIIDFTVKLSEMGILNPDSVKIIVQKFLDTFQFGSTAEFMEALEEGAPQLNEEQISAVKVAVLEVLKDAGLVGPEADQKLVDSTKVGTVEALKDTGVIENKKPEKIDPPVKVDFKSLPPEGKSQAAAMSGLSVAPEEFEKNERKERRSSMASEAQV